MKVANNTVRFVWKLGSDKLRADVGVMTGKADEVKLLTTKRKQGFTLVELLVALFVFSLLSAFSYRAVNQLSDTGANVAAQAEALETLQKAMRLWESDVQRMIIRSQSVNAGGNFSPDLGGAKDSIEFPLMVEPSRQGQYVTDLKWVRYSLKGNVLFRDVWDRQNQGNDEPSVSLPILTHVTALDFASQGLDGAVKGNSASSVPSSISINLQHESLGAVKRFFYVGTQEPDKDFSSLNDTSADAGLTLSDEDARLCLGATRC